MTVKILHVAYLEKFIPGFVELINQHFSDGEHTFLTFGDLKKYPYKTYSSIHLSNGKSIIKIYKLILSLHRANKVLLHGIFSPQLIAILCFMPWLHKKCYWVVWGGDLYVHKLAIKNTRFFINEIFRKFFISRLGGFVTYVDGDYQNAKKWYGAKGKLYECIMYKSNIYAGGNFSDKIQCKVGFDSGKVNILLGNSADVSNNHKYIFEKLAMLDIEGRVGNIYCPLSYGDLNYAKKIKSLGESLFGSKFKALTDFMPLSEYNNILDDVDIAIFAHNRQQGMGNIINLLGRGKKVYMKSDTTSYSFFTKKGVMVYPVDKLNLNIQSEKISETNNEIISSYFNEENLIEQLKNIFH